MALSDTAHEIYSACQLAPGEGVVDAVARIESLLTEAITAARAPAESVLEDAARYRAFIECGQPICFMGEEYYGKAALDAAIDATMNKGGA